MYTVGNIFRGYIDDINKQITKWINTEILRPGIRIITMMQSIVQEFGGPGNYIASVTVIAEQINI